MAGSLYEYEAARALGVKAETLAKARLAGVVSPRHAGRAYLYSDADLAAFRAHRSGMTAKQVAHALGIPRSRVTALRRSGRLPGKPIAGKVSIECRYDPADVERLRRG